MPLRKTVPAAGNAHSRPKRGNSAELRAKPKKIPSNDHYEFFLYVTGNSPRSGLAIANIRSVCEEYLSDRYTLEVVDIYQQPARAAEEQIIAAPTLFQRFPLPAKRLIGDLSDRARVISALNLAIAGAHRRKV